MIVFKSSNEIQKMMRAGEIVAEVLSVLEKEADVGVKTGELDRIAEKIIREEGGRPAFKGYKSDFMRGDPFPASVCISVNDVVVHGIPDDYTLTDGDLVSMDTGVELDGYYGDASITVIVGKPTPEALNLVEVTRRSMEAAIEQCFQGNQLSDVSHVIQATAEGAGFSVVRRFVGHGIGRKMHEEPPVPNFGKPGGGPELKPGVVLAIEPMVNQGTSNVMASAEKWPVRTEDGKLSAHFEHTVAITEDGHLVLTERSGKEAGATE